MIRRLTSGEIALAREAFGDDLRVQTVRLLSAPPPLRRAFVPGRWFGREWIVWPNLPADISLQPLGLQATLVHELTHVWQAQAGISLLFAKLKAGDRPASYAYAIDPACAWDALNIEQQAMVVEHRFRLMHGSEAPGDHAFYDRVCPLARRTI